MEKIHGYEKENSDGRNRPFTERLVNMSKVAVVYWSGGGNTAQMATAVMEGIQAAGGEATVFFAGEFDSSKMDDFDAIAFGCPAMGAEVLEESEFEPMFRDCESKLSGKKIVLFGSYGWGDGEWMRTWESECKADGAVFAYPCVIAHETPDEDVLAQCKAAGKALV